MILMTTLFRMSGTLASDRLKEFKFCIKKNLDNPIVEKVYVVWEENANKVPPNEYQPLGDPFPLDDEHLFLNHPKVKVWPWGGRPTYSDFFRFARDEHLEGKVIAIHNTDIWFDETLAVGETIPENVIYAVTRYNVGQGGLLSGLQGGGRGGSSDTWIFRFPLRPFDADILLGVIGCDSYFCQKAFEAGIFVANPCLSIRSYHQHHVALRNDTPDGKNYWNAPGYASMCAPPCEIVH
jgi:hypothetical protein